MGRLAPRDRIMLATLLPLCIVCLVLHVRAGVRGQPAWMGVHVTPPEHTGAYPTVRALWGYQAEGSGLAIGDRLVRVGSADLRGAGRVGLFARALAEAGRDARVPVAFLRNGTAGEVTLALERIPFPWGNAVLALAFVASAVLVLLRAPLTPLTRTKFVADTSLSLTFLFFQGGAVLQTYAWVTVFFAALCVAFPLVLRAVWLFPAGVAAVGSPARRAAWVFALMGPAVASMFFGAPFRFEVGGPLFAILVVGFTATVALALTRNFRRADRIGRRQIKWVLFGCYLGVTPVLTGAVLFLIDPHLLWAYQLSTIALVAFPICVLIATVRFNLFDIDRLISATASYSTLLVVLLAAVFVLVPRVAAATSAAFGVEPWFAQAAFALACAAGAGAGHHWLRPWVDRVLYPERVVLERGVADLLGELGRCATPQEVTALIGERVEALLRPECCVIYARSGSAYAPVFVRGRAVPAAFEAGTPLVATLEARGTPLAAERWGQPRGRGELSSFDRAALETFGVEAIVPVRRGPGLAVFLCLGAKRSGDVYTSTELTLLAVVADKVSTVLERFDDADVLRETRRMQAELSRYVPAPVADRVARGVPLPSGPREVTVLFVDLRGYSSFSEGRPTTEVFSTVNRFTEAASRIVGEHGGSVVEFTGDGLMAVFGAPEPLSHKERAAVEAALTIVSAAEAWAPHGPTTRAQGLSVGVGVATGEAFVGDIRSVDRLIWTAVGHTPNLAARLQALTRDLDASIVIDHATRQAAGDAAAGFAAQTATIRGLRQPAAIHVLPMAMP